jgi:hypothetical protein
MPWVCQLVAHELEALVFQVLDEIGPGAGGGSAGLAAPIFVDGLDRVLASQRPALGAEVFWFGHWYFSTYVGGAPRRSLSCRPRVFHELPIGALDPNVLPSQVATRLEWL